MTVGTCYTAIMDAAKLLALNLRSPKSKPVGRAIDVKDSKHAVPAVTLVNDVNKPPKSAR